MTDRELLELAAKAAGINIKMWEAGDPYRMKASGAMAVWNPLTDDGDALRLAVALRITVEQSLLETQASAYVLVGLKKAHFVSVSGKVAREEATRRAIVRAAAEIGRNMLSSNP